MSDQDPELMLHASSGPREAAAADDEAVAAARLWQAADRVWMEEGERWRQAEPALLVAAQDGGPDGLLAYQEGAARHDRAERTAWAMLTRVLTSRPRTPNGAVAILRAMRSLGEDQLQHPDLGTALASVIRFLEQARL